VDNGRCSQASTQAEQQQKKPTFEVLTKPVHLHALPTGRVAKLNCGRALNVVTLAILHDARGASWPGVATAAPFAPTQFGFPDRSPFLPKQRNGRRVASNLRSKSFFHFPSEAVTRKKFEPEGNVPTASNKMGWVENLDNPKLLTLVAIKPSQM
jgi:hypothetical protein